MKKIIFTVTNDLNYDQRMIRICDSLNKAGFEVLLVGRMKKKSPVLKTQSFKQRRLFCFFQKGKFFYLEYNIRLLFFLLFRRFDALCAIDLDTIVPVYLAGKLKQKILIYDAHEYFTEVPEVIRRPKIKALWSWVARTFIPRMDFCYTVGPSLAKIMGEEYGKSFEVIRNVPFKYEGTPSKEKATKEFIILYQGALNEGRGIEQAIQAMQYLPEQVKLWLAGEGDLSTALRKMVKDLNLSEKVHFWGFLAPEELKKLTPRADLGLNLLENKGLSYYYSLANKCFDYIQAGVPGINMDFPEYVALQKEFHCLILLQALEPRLIAQKINELRRDESHFMALKNKCQLAAQQLNWDLEKEKLVKLYNKYLDLGFKQT